MKPIIFLIFIIGSLNFTQAQDSWSIRNDSLLRVIRKSDNDSVKANTYSELKEIWQTKNFKKAIQYGHLALTNAQKGGSKKQSVSIMYQLAYAYMSIGNASASIDMLQQILPLTKEDLDLQGTALSFIAMNYVIIKDYDNALKYMRKAFALEVIMNKKGQFLDQRSYLGSRMNMAIVFIGKNQIDSALYYGKIAYERLKSEKKLLSESKHFEWSIPCIYGDAQRKAQHNQEAMQLYQEALRYAQSQNTTTGINNVKFSLAQLFNQLKQYDSSLVHALQALEGFQQNSDYPKISETGLLLHTLYKQKNNAIKALKFYEIGLKAQDSVMNREKILQVQYLEDKAERQKQELEIAYERKQNLLRLYILLIGLALIGIIAFILFRNNQQKQRLNEKLVAQKKEIEELNEGLEQKVEHRTAELKNALNDVRVAFERGQSTERKRVSADLHDEIGSALSTIAIFSDVTKQKAQQTAPQLVNALEKIGAKSREMVQTMRDTIWTLNDDVTQNLWERMQQYGLETLSGHEILLDWNVYYTNLPTNLSFSTKRHLFLAYKEAIHNIVKHAEATKVIVDMKIKSGDLQFEISDNGKGFDIAKAHNDGNGLLNFQKRMNEIGGNVQIVSKISVGTRLIFQIPIINL